MKLLNISLPNALSIWSDLESAYYGNNGYGGHVAEIYAYRIKPLGPVAAEAFRSTSSACAEALDEEIHELGAILFALLKEFQRTHPCRILVDGRGPRMLVHDGLLHRCHVEIRTANPTVQRMRQAARG